MLKPIYIILILNLVSTGFANAQIPPKRQKAIELTKKGILIYCKDSFVNKIHFYDEAISLDSTYEDAYYARAVAFFRNGQFEEAVKDCHWLDLHHVEYLGLEYMGPLDFPSNHDTKYQEQNRYQDIEKFYTIAIKLYPDDGHFYANLGLFYFEPHNPESTLKPKFDKAAEMLEKAVNLNYTSAEIYSKLGYSLMQIDENKRAVIYFSKAIDVDPNDVDNFFNRGNAFLAIHQLQAAIDDYHVCLKSDSTNPYLWYNLGHAQYGLNDFAGSDISLKKALEIQPGFQDTWFRLGLSYGDQGDYRNAVNAFSEAIKQYPQDAYLYYNRAVAKAKADPKSDYCSDLKTAADMGYGDAITMKAKLCK